jgi:hypothetical protein
MSDLSQLDVHAFLSLVRDRLTVGRREYGDASFERPVAELLGEIEEELLDVVGWSAVVFARVQRMKREAADE